MTADLKPPQQCQPRATKATVSYPQQNCLQFGRLTNSREQQEIVTLSLQLLQNSLMLIKTILVEQTIEREGV